MATGDSLGENRSWINLARRVFRYRSFFGVWPLNRAHLVYEGVLCV